MSDRSSMRQVGTKAFYGDQHVKFAADRDLMALVMNGQDGLFQE